MALVVMGLVLIRKRMARGCRHWGFHGASFFCIDFGGPRG